MPRATEILTKPDKKKEKKESNGVKGAVKAMGEFMFGSGMANRRREEEKKRREKQAKLLEKAQGGK